MKKILSITLAVASIGQQTCAMQPLAARTAGQIAKHYGKKGFSGMMTALHWTIAAGSSIYEGWQSVKILSNEPVALAEFSNADENVNNFITTSLAKNININSHAVKVTSEIIDNRSFPEIRAFGKHIILNSAMVNEITKAQQNNYVTDLNKWNAVTEHAGIMIKNKDLLWQTAGHFALPFITHGAVKIARNALPIAKKTRSFLEEQLIKIPTALGKQGITGLGNIFFGRYLEQRGDSHMSNNIETLTGFRNYLRDAHRYKINNIKKQFNCPDEQAEFQSWADDLLARQNSIKSRLAKFDKRIETLKQKRSIREKHS